MAFKLQSILTSCKINELRKFSQTSKRVQHLFNCFQTFTGVARLSSLKAAQRVMFSWNDLHIPLFYRAIPTWQNCSLYFICTYLQFGKLDWVIRMICPNSSSNFLHRGMRKMRNSFFYSSGFGEIALFIRGMKNNLLFWGSPKLP